MKANESIQPETATLDTWVEGKPFTIQGDYEAVAEQLPRADAYIKGMQALESAAVSRVEAPVARVNTEPVIVDLSTLEPREVARRKMQAWFFDRTHGSTMLTLFNERLAEDRNVAMAMRLGIITTDRCAKHERIARNLRGML